MGGRLLRRWSSAIVIASVMVVGGCGFNKEKPDETLNWSADKLYAEAKAELSAGNWTNSIKMLERLESRYPFGRYAEQAQIDLAYAHYKDNDPVQAIAAADRFIKLHPNHPRLDYIYYLKGLVNFNDGAGLLSKLGGQDLTERDPKAAREAFDSFKELITRFPNSQYAADAETRMKYLVNALAASEVNVARYYLRRGAFLAAINRAQVVVKQFQSTPAVEEALAIMIAGYGELGLNDLRDDTRRVLTSTYPNSNYLKSYSPSRRGGDKSWWQVW